MLGIAAVKVAFTAAKAFCVKNSSVLLTGLGIGAFAGAVGLTAKLTPKYEQALLDKAEEKGEAPNRVDKLKIRAKVYWAVALLFLAGSAAIIANTAFQMQKIAGLTTALVAAEQAAEDKTLAAVNEALGPEAAEKVKENLEENKSNNDIPDVEERDVIDIGGGNDLIYDATSDTFLRSSPKYLNTAMEKGVAIAKNSGDDAISFNDARNFMSSKLAPLSIGYDNGWNIYDAQYDDGPALRFEPIIQKGRLCYKMTFRSNPVPLVFGGV